MPEPAALSAGDYRCGYVTILGRPNVGKSTVLNRLLGQKLSIVSRRPQTTRWQILGIKSTDCYQAIFIDTPGVQTRYSGALERYMNREINNALVQVDVLLLVIEAMKWTPADRRVLGLLEGQGKPVVLVINKVDKVRPRQQLLGFMREMAKRADFAALIPVSARTGDNMADLEKTVVSLLPYHAPEFPADQVTDRSERFLAGEYVREKLTRRLAQELPYSISVTIERFRRKRGVVYVDAVIWVESESQKAIVIGKGGNILKSVGERARRDMEALFECRVNLQLWVKVRRRWTRSEAALQQFGYASEKVKS